MGQNDCTANGLVQNKLVAETERLRWMSGKYAKRWVEIRAYVISQ